MMTQSKPKYHDLLSITENYVGLRLCLSCNKMLPIDKFKPNRYEHTCIEHLRARKCHSVLGTADKKAFNSLRCRARSDMIMFGHKQMKLSRQELMKIITKQQLQNYSKYCVIPRRPDEILTVDNIVIVESSQRRYVVGRWKRTEDANQYVRDLALILSMPECKTLGTIEK